MKFVVGKRVIKTQNNWTNFSNQKHVSRNKTLYKLYYIQVIMEKLRLFRISCILYLEIKILCSYHLSRQQRQCTDERRTKLLLEQIQVWTTLVSVLQTQYMQRSALCGLSITRHHSKIQGINTQKAFRRSVVNVYYLHIYIYLSTRCINEI